MEYTGSGQIEISSFEERNYNVKLIHNLSSSYSIKGLTEYDFIKSFSTNWDIVSNDYYWWRVVGACRIYNCPSDQILSLSTDQSESCRRIGYITNNNISITGQAEIIGNFEPVPIVDSPVVIVDSNFNQNQKCNDLFEKTIYDLNQTSPSDLSLVTTVLARSLSDVCSILKEPKLGPPLKDFRIISIQRYKNPIGSEDGVTSELIEQDFCNIPECFDYCLDFDLFPAQDNICNPNITLDMFVIALYEHESNVELEISGSSESLVVFSSDSIGSSSGFSFHLVPTSSSTYTKILFNSKIYLNVTGFGEFYSNIYSYFPDNNVINFIEINNEFITNPIFSQGGITLSSDTPLSSSFWNYNSDLLLNLVSNNNYKINLSISNINKIILNNVLNYKFVPKYFIESIASLTIGSVIEFASNYYGYEADGLIEIDSNTDSNVLYNPWIRVGEDIYGEVTDGYSGDVSVSGNSNVLAIGEYGNDGNGTNSGSVRIFEKINNSWNQIGNTLYGDSSESYFGKSISLNQLGDIVVVGGYYYSNEKGIVKVFSWDGLSWNQMGDSIIGENDGDANGICVSINSQGNRIAMGANVGNYVRVFEWNDSEWIQLGSNINGNSGDLFGNSIDLSKSGNRIIIGSPNYDSSKGFIKVFDWDGANWNQLGETLYGNNSSDSFGNAVAINHDGNMIVAASDLYIKSYIYDGLSWDGIFNPIEILPGTNDNFSSINNHSLDMNYDGDIIAIGAKSSDFRGTDSGRVIFYKFDGNNWNLLGNKINGDNIGDYTGSSVCLDDSGFFVVVGSSNFDYNETDNGRTVSYYYSGIVWSYDSLVDLNFSGSFDKLSISNIISENQEIEFLGSADFYYNNLFNFTGGLSISGQVNTISSPNFNYDPDPIYFDPDGIIVIDGESINSFISLPGLYDELVSKFYLYSSYDNYQLDYIEDETVSEILVDTNRVNVCGCNNLSKTLNIFQNIEYSAVFSSFISANKIPYDPIVNLNYRSNSNSWNKIQHYKGLLFDNEVYWTFIYSLLCTNIIDGQETDNYYYKFDVDIRYRNSNSTLYTKFFVNIDLNEICGNNRLSTEITIDTNRGGVLVNDIYTDFYSIIDGIGLFSNDYWNRNIVYDRVRTGQDKFPRITGEYPKFIINDFVIADTSRNGYVKIEL